ncbi:replication protein A 70 kDa DNA-binding subunit B-like [Capsicum galapagoense]
MDDIDKHQNKLTLFSTYLISTVKVREPLPYGLPVNTFEWVVDRFTVVEQIKEYNTGDPPLPASTRLNTISLANLEQEPRHVEFGISLTTRYNSIILTNPVYPQVAELTNWVKNNEEILNTYTERSSAAMLLHDDIIPIGNIETQSAMQYFYVEGKMSFLDDDDQIFYELMCPKCKNVVRTKIIKGIDCGNCQEHTMLTLRCCFQVQIIDGSGSTTVILLGEKDPLPLQSIQQHLANTMFKIHLRKSYSRHSDDAPAKLFVSSFVEKQDALQLPPLSASANVGESSKRELDNASSPDELKKPTTGSTSSKI